MSISRNEFLEIINSSIAQQLLLDEEISSLVRTFREENWAALLHANNITAETPVETARDLLQLVAAFARKDVSRLHELVHIKKVSVGARLDYFLPLYDASYHGGEDIFVASTKILLGGSKTDAVHLKPGAMIHQVGAQKGKPYTNRELQELETYVNNSFEIREILRHAPNQTVIQPNLNALHYIIQHAKTYLDTNNNPVIVFIPGAISINNLPASTLIEKVLNQGADINATGFFGVPGIVWSIILGDVNSIKKFLEHDARLDIVDEMQSVNVLTWAKATSKAIINDSDYIERLSIISSELNKKRQPLTAKTTSANNPVTLFTCAKNDQVNSGSVLSTLPSKHR